MTVNANGEVEVERFDASLDCLGPGK